MRTNYKFHAVAISALCAVITLLYFLIGPTPAKPPEEQQAKGSRYVSVYSATWGENCNDSIAEVMRAREMAPPQKDADGKPVVQDKLTKVVQNNVLSSLSALCDGKPGCMFRADAATLGVDPMPGCAKKFSASYRCYSYDALHSVDVDQGATVTMDCTPPTPAASAPGQAPANAAPVANK